MPWGSCYNIMICLHVHTCIKCVFSLIFYFTFYSITVASERFPSEEEYQPTAPSVADVFSHLKSLATREERNTWLLNKAVHLPGETWIKYCAAVEQERAHIRHVRMIMAAKTGLQNDHDWSKDEYYFFVTISFFTLGERQLMMDEFTTEVNRHYQLEAHHPENEALTGRHVTEYDVMETAADRLSRNLQKNDGQLNMDQMTRFEPKFASRQEENLKVYWRYVHELFDLVRSTFDTAFNPDLLSTQL